MERLIRAIIIRPVEWLKAVTGAKTWHIESLFVFTVLVMVAVLAGRSWKEWLGVFAVQFTFHHASVANRLEEQEHERVRLGSPAQVTCYRWLQRYFYLKETLWFLYFLLIGAYSALVGVFVFLLYGWWRKTWRRYHPLQKTLT